MDGQEQNTLQEYLAVHCS